MNINHKLPRLKMNRKLGQSSHSVLLDNLESLLGLTSANQDENDLPKGTRVEIYLMYKEV